MSTTTTASGSPISVGLGGGNDVLFRRGFRESTTFAID